MENPQKKTPGNWNIPIKIILNRPANMAQNLNLLNIS